jgi:hypothetical protein
MIIFKLFTIIIGIIPLLYFLVYRKQDIGTLKPILPFIILTFIASIYEFFGTLTFGWNVSNWFIIYNILSFLAINYFYHKLIQTKFQVLNNLFLLAFILLCYILFVNYQIKDFLIISTYFKGFITLFVLLFSVLWFIKIFQEVYVDNLLKNSIFYFVSGFILYYCGTLFLFLLSNYILKVDTGSLHSYWMVNVILNLILRILLLIGLWKAKVD